VVVYFHHKFGNENPAANNWTAIYLNLSPLAAEYESGNRVDFIAI
jgi:hypothetical protein